MDPAGASQLFYAALVAVPGWSTVPPHLAAQAVQGSAYSDGSNCLVHRQLGVDLAAQLLGGTTTSPDGGGRVQLGVAPAGQDFASPQETRSNPARGPTGKLLSERQAAGWEWDDRACHRRRRRPRCRTSGPPTRPMRAPDGSPEPLNTRGARAT